MRGQYAWKGCVKPVICSIMRVVSVVLLLLLTAAAPPSTGTYVLEDFAGDTVGDLPRNWYNRDGNQRPQTYDQALRDTYHYRIMQEGSRKFLRYDGSQAKHLTLQIGKDESINIRETPILSWDWRIHAVPDGANEFADARNDVAASVYVVWGFNLLRVPKVVRYTWSSTQPVGRTGSRNSGMQHVVVMESGTDKAGRWITFERNIVEDYNRFFRGRVPERPVAILILSDADDTRSSAKADYGRFLLKRAQ